MKLFNREQQDQVEQNNERRWSKRIKQYWRNLYRSDKCTSMSHGSYDIVRSMSWARGENWRRNHPKSLNKHHK
jgi:hypothetical protein